MEFIAVAVQLWTNRTNNSTNRKYRWNTDFSLAPNYLRTGDNIFIRQKRT